MYYSFFVLLKTCERRFNELRSQFTPPTARQIFEPSPDFQNLLTDFLNGLQLHDYSVQESCQRDEAFDYRQQPDNSSDTSSNETNVIAEIVHVERFTLKYGRTAQLINDGYICRDNGGFLTGDGCAVGGGCYWDGIHKISMRVERVRPFIGILSHVKDIVEGGTRLKEPRFYQFPYFYRTLLAHGWCTSSSLSTHTYHWYPEYRSYRIIDGKEDSTQTEEEWIIPEDKDVFQLTLNCDARQLGILNERTGNEDTIYVKQDCAPFPWCLFVVFCDLKSEVHLLKNSKRKETGDSSLVPSNKINTSSYSSRE